MKYNIFDIIRSSSGRTGMNFGRYDKHYPVSTSQNPLLDVTEWLGFLKSKDFVVDLLVKKHGVSSTEAASRSSLIVPHIELAIEYLEESLSGKKGISFLNSYYAILNLIKVYILFGKYHGELATNRHHGATYKVNAPSNTLLTELITIKPNGAIPLFYKTLTDQNISADKEISLSTILGFLSGISYEYSISTETQQKIVALNFMKEKVEEVERVLAYVVHPASPEQNLQELKVLVGYVPHPTDKRKFVGPQFNEGDNFQNKIRDSLNRILIYRSSGYIRAPICSDSFLFPQEIPPVLFFYYMSNIVRYKPDFFSSLKSSKYWPMVSASQKHSLLEFLINAWSFFQKENYYINEEP